MIHGNVTVEGDGWFADFDDFRPCIYDDVEEEIMTVCVAGICSDGKSILVACDKLLTCSSDDTVESTGVRAKACVFDGQYLIAFSGELAVQGDVIELATQYLSTSKKSYREVLATLECALSDLRNERANLQVFASRGTTLKEFYASVSAKSDMNAFERGLDRKNESVRLGVRVLFCGVRNGEADISVVDGVLDRASFGAVGYVGVGSGKRTAEAWLRAVGYRTSMSREEALYAIYEAKKAAEAAPGVGSETDLFLVDSNGVTELPGEVVECLDKIWQSRQELLRSLFSSDEADLIRDVLS